MNDRIGKWNFWLVFVGFNATFFPMHFLGIAGMPRRYYSYGEGSGWWFWNVVVSSGAFVLAAGILVFLYNIAYSLQRGKIAGPNPWDAPTLEWSTSSPPPVYNFRDVPHVEHRDPLWAEKYGIDEHEDDVSVTIAGNQIGSLDPGWKDKNPHSVLYHQAPAVDDDHGVHLPNPSYYPLIAAIGFALIAVGLLFENPDINIGAMPMPVVSLLGIVTMIGGIVGWSFEPAD
jgi:hypothetical protein